MIKLDFYDCILYPIIGGVLIAIASSLNLYLKGRITGFSGIIYNLWSKNDSRNNPWRWSFIYGVCISAALLKIKYDYRFFDSHSVFVYSLSSIGLLTSGLFTGFGTKVANGCTSGHGVCGLPRFSKRSYLSTLFYMGVGVIVATSRYYKPFFYQNDFLIDFHKNISNNSFFIKYYDLYSFIAVSSLFFVIYATLEVNKNKGIIIDSNKYLLSDIIIGCILGLIFGSGLAIGGMMKRSKLLGFMQLNSSWDPTLLILFGTVVIINTFTFNIIIHKVERPLLNYDNSIAKSFNYDRIDLNLIFGSIMYGIGLGLSGICVGPAVGESILYFPYMILYVLFLIIGQFLGNIYMIKFSHNLKSRDIENELNK